MKPRLDIELLPPAERWRESVLRGLRELQGEGLAWYLGVDLDAVARDFPAFVADALADAHRRTAAFVPRTHLWAVAGGQFVGRVSLRHELTDALRREGGHIGYDTVPAFRGRGVATSMLRQVLPVARGLGLSEVLLTCDDTNEASIRVIERNGGVLRETRELAPDRPLKRYYWIALSLALLLLAGCGSPSRPAPLNFGDGGGATPTTRHDASVRRLGVDAGVKLTPENACRVMAASCGTVSLPATKENPCGEEVTCGTCADGEVCNAATHQCGPCPPITCASVGAACGKVTDGCGKTLDCGACAAPKICDVLSLQCVTCERGTCGGGRCGTVSDGCGGTLSCGGCEEGLACQSGLCAPIGIAPECAAAKATCGYLPGLCGLTTEFCGTCGEKQECVGNQCIPCPAPSCAGAECGTAYTCLGSLVCGGSCTAPAVCVGIHCCTPMTCDDLAPGACGGDDGCGTFIPCATCPSGTCDYFSGACSAASSSSSGASSSSSSGCTPQNPCATLCGPQSDGCGHVLACANGPQCATSSSSAPPIDAGRPK